MNGHVNEQSTTGRSAASGAGLAGEGLEARLGLEHSYAALPPAFYALVTPKPVTRPELLRLNLPLARELGLDLEGQPENELAALFSASAITANGGKLVAMAYSGHQFGQFNPGLGDGRAALIGEVVAPDGQRFDLHLKGSGPTPFSRQGDGRAALGPVMREYIVSEAMHALGIPTTRSLAMVTTGEPVIREGIEPGAVLVRVAASHLRVGSFQHFAARQDMASLKRLLDYAIARHDPDLDGADNPALAFFEAVLHRQADLIAQWMAAGFIHGVMNTDNMTISGETIDYGPCAFMDHYEHYKVYSSIDRQGRYAYGAQPSIAKWNLARLAETLLPLIDENDEKALEKATTALERFDAAFGEAWLARMGAKLGLAAASEDDKPLILDFLTLMHKAEADFTNSFAALETELDDGTAAGPSSPLQGAGGHREWLDAWKKRLAGKGSIDDVRTRLRTVNPVYIPRNHLVEEAIRAGVDKSDFTVMDRLVEVIRHPFGRRDGLDRFALPPEPDEVVHQTFCGT